MPFFLTLFVISFVLISWAGSSLVRSLAALSRLFGLSEYLISFLFMSFVTSLPELFIGISSALQHVPQISFGDTFGASIIKLSFIIGIVALFTGKIAVESKISKKNFFLISLLAFMPFLLLSDGVLSRGDGILLILLFVIYLTRLFREKEYFTKQTWNHNNTPGILKHIRAFFVGSAALIVGAYALILSSKFLAEFLEMSAVFFGLLIVAVGTTLPEIMFGFRAARLKHTSMMLGNALGSIAFNATVVIGIVALIEPITISINGHLIVAALFLFIVLVLFNIFAYTRAAISRAEGLMLLCIYLAFILTELFIFSF
ncbi:MAG: hypothetical protein COW88_01600 [Candidatus Lloydbacteria bacterium CG22_combo_CG10-13_8_21_14_all_47_15]|uniref:Sodium/calcium exchanger membrane region domain-containing protein n=1 Tax=Candidatus Lloydbacteria bacterium CG22_combo_CG10-13_8_21_14_all_47_15 TaxID=1974635 RepID=A0A2H0CUE1_9BACT|nr:MAG: hypothetical protein COW88_01600 [Candidatus Lloydbacteria bacterium CG22_combo_CG10-13_8_21_14_all_47_15]